MGNKFVSEKAMCRFWNISYQTYYERKNKGTILSSKKLKLAFPRCYKLVLNKYSFYIINNVKSKGGKRNP